MDALSNAVVVSSKHPRLSEENLKYGTAGFRMRAEKLDHVVYRMGLLSVVFSKYKGGMTGLMITASHNPEEDNGIKCMSTLGEMMPMSWEKYATDLINVSDSLIESCLKDIIKAENVDMSKPGNVMIGMDTRPSSQSLAQAATDGIEALGGTCKNMGLLSTPQLHFMVCCVNTQGQYGEPTEEGYYKKLSKAFITLNSTGSTSKYSPKLYLDLANGVGAPKMKEMTKHLNGLLSINFLNDMSSGKLNYKCGADFVKVQQTAPESMTLESGMRCASFDGDADRIVYFYKNDMGKFCLLDGDKIATLVAGYLSDLVKSSGLSLNLGLVQTAYANGSSTNYITDIMKVPVACVPTGVKYLHHKAQDFDIGVYFEANGHGTVLFNNETIKAINEQAKKTGLDDATKDAACKLETFMNLINQTVGDAISDLLVVETVLRQRDWSCSEWDTAYTDLPSRQIKVKVADRTVVETTDAERRTTKPSGLQEAIDSLVAEYKKGRSFVRPSGTEDVVRIYAEADTQYNADKLAYEVGTLVYERANGTGSKPSPPS